MDCNEKCFFVLLFFHLSSYIQIPVFAIITDEEVNHDIESNWNSAGRLENHIKNELNIYNPNQSLKILMKIFFLGIGKTVTSLSSLCYSAANELTDTNLATTGLQLFDAVVSEIRGGREEDGWLIVGSYRAIFKQNIIMYFKGVQYCKIQNDLFKGKMISLYKDIMEMDQKYRERKNLTNKKTFHEIPAQYEQQSAPIPAY